jgi:hypothetical protein
MLQKSKTVASECVRAVLNLLDSPVQYRYQSNGEIDLHQSTPRAFRFQMLGRLDMCCAGQNSRGTEGESSIIL